MVFSASVLAAVGDQMWIVSTVLLTFGLGVVCDLLRAWGLPV